jgi:hypothetical protein
MFTIAASQGLESRQRYEDGREVDTAEPGRYARSMGLYYGTVHTRPVRNRPDDKEERPLEHIVDSAMARKDQ